MENFVKIYILCSLWFLAGICLSTPLRKAFGEMHLRIVKRVYALIGRQARKRLLPISVFIVRKLKQVSHYIECQIEESRYELRVSAARSLVSKELLEELKHKNLVAAISQARRIDQGDSGVGVDELQRMGDLVMGKKLGADGRKEVVETAFRLCDTDLFEQLIARIPHAQERILLALDRIEGLSPYQSVRNEAYWKFIRQ